MSLPFNIMVSAVDVDVARTKTPHDIVQEVMSFLRNFDENLSKRWPTNDGTWPFKSMADVKVGVPSHLMTQIDYLYQDTQPEDLFLGNRIVRQIRLVEALEFLGKFFEYDEVVMTDAKGRYTDKTDVLEYLSAAGLWWPIDFNASKDAKHIIGIDCLRQMTRDTHAYDRTPVPIWDTEAIKRWCGTVWPLINMEDVRRLDHICKTTRESIHCVAGFDLYETYYELKQNEDVCTYGYTDEQIISMILDSGYL
jgi:hypothetical protein